MSKAKVTVKAVRYHGFTCGGEIELDVRYRIEKGEPSKEELLKLSIKAANASSILRLQNVHLRKRNTRIVKLSETYAKLYVEVRGK
jgi:hypothetical protein